MKKVKILQQLDQHNMDKMGTQFAKSTKMRESTYNILRDMKKNDRTLKSIDDVIVQLITLAAMFNKEK